MRGSAMTTAVPSSDTSKARKQHDEKTIQNLQSFRVVPSRETCEGIGDTILCPVCVLPSQSNLRTKVYFNQGFFDRRFALRGGQEQEMMVRILSITLLLIITLCRRH